MASLLGNLIYAGQQTLLTTSLNLGHLGSTAINIASINGGQGTGVPPDVALFQPGALSQSFTATSAGYGGCTLAPLLITRSAAVALFFNPNTTALPGDLLMAYWHSRIR